jgi:NADPH-dependent 2,4-dienoyl-CoA reductase/sulfur reductase-like enzyme
MRSRDLVIVGGGPAGMAAAIAAYEHGVRDILLIERDQFLGGILNQCIHPGFGIDYFDEVLTGPEYSDRFVKKIRSIPEIEVSLRSFAVSLDRALAVTFIRPGRVETVKPKAVIMATGCREKTREMIPIPGSRPAGVFPAGLAQKLINIEGFLPGKEAVIVGSGDIGLIMARRMVLEGAKVKAVIEILKESRGLRRNISQCLDDFGTKLFLSHKATKIHGSNRVEGISAGKVDKDFNVIPGTEFDISCDTVLISVGLIPENELIEMAGAEIDKTTNSPVSEELNTTSIPGIFVCGNSYKVYDIVDSVSRDSVTAGRMAAEHIRKGQCRKK